MAAHVPTAVVDAPCSPRDFAPGTILVSASGQIKIIRSRTSDDTGWNCADGAAIRDDQARDTDLWRAYTPEHLAADLLLAADVRQLAGHKVMGGGIATWDACSGRPCILPKLAKLVNRPTGGPWDAGWAPED